MPAKSRSRPLRDSAYAILNETVADSVELLASAEERLAAIRHQSAELRRCTAVKGRALKYLNSIDSHLNRATKELHAVASRLQPERRTSKVHSAVSIRNARSTRQPGSCKGIPEAASPEMTAAEFKVSRVSAEAEKLALPSEASLSLGGVWAPNESDELLRLAVQVGGVGIFDSDLRAKRTRFSPELCAILGLPNGTEMSNEEASRLIDER